MEFNFPYSLVNGEKVIITVAEHGNEVLTSVIVPVGEDDPKRLLAIACAEANKIRMEALLEWSIKRQELPREDIAGDGECA